MKKRIGISIWQFQHKFGDKEALRIAKQIGADSVDFSLEGSECDYRNPDSLYAKGEEAIRAYYSELREYAEEIGLVIGQTHGKLPGFRNIPAEDEALIENTRLDCIATASLGAEVMVVHNATSIYLGPNPDPELMQDLSLKMFKAMLPFAKQNGIKIATETFGDAVRFSAVDFFGDINEFEKAYKAVKDIPELKDYITICVDTGHSNKAMRYDNPTPADVIRRLGKEVTCLHLNDNDTLTDQHKMPLSGCIDWENVMNALDEIGYNGIYNMELNLRHFGEALIVDYAEFAIKVMRNILDKRDNK
ncbi:MAG: sugar phosphate isomerase/epimerase [Clostridia bacterium]|nr:sugar phosphate isomerase/epimerase [Clostridia bacterium]